MNTYLSQEQIIESNDLTFSIKRLTASDKVTEVSVNFPLISRPNNHLEIGDQNDEIIVNRTIPVFNNDNCFYTPSFILENDLEKVEKNLNSYFNFHSHKVK